jgi:hypothetical protein
MWTECKFQKQLPGKGEPIVLCTHPDRKALQIALLTPGVEAPTTETAGSGPIVLVIHGEKKSYIIPSGALLVPPPESDEEKFYDIRCDRPDICNRQEDP